MLVCPAFYWSKIELLDVIPVDLSAAAMRSSARLWIWETRLSLMLNKPPISRMVAQRQWYSMRICLSRRGKDSIALPRALRNSLRAAITSVPEVSSALRSDGETPGFSLRS